MKPFVKRSKKRPQAVVETRMVHPTPRECRLCQSHGRHLGCVSSDYDVRHPLVCMDESNKQLLGEVREPLPMTPETPVRSDAEYERHGTGNLFLAFAPYLESAVFEPAHFGSQPLTARSVSLGSTAQYVGSQCRLALHYRRCAYQTQTPLPQGLNLAEY